MFRSRKKFLAYLSTFSLFIQQFAPLALVVPLARAQDEPVASASIDPSPTAVVEPSPEPSVEPSIEPTATPAETATPVPTTTPEPSPSVDPVVTEVALTATITTDKLDYYPWESVTVTGSGLMPIYNYELIITSNDPPAVTHIALITTNVSGEFTSVYTLDGNYRPNYSIELKDGEAVVATTTFTDANPATDISQCQNGGIGDTLQPCSETAPYAAANGYGYEGNANSNGSNSHWYEGDFVPIRIVATNYAAGAGNIQFSIDVTKGGKHAYDYIGSFDATETLSDSTSTHANHNNPVTDIRSGESPNDPDSEGDIPPATLSPFPVACGSNTFTGSQIAGKIRAWGTSGNLTVTYPSQNVGSSDCSTTVQVAWPDTEAGFGGTIVIAYAAHIATEENWGTGNSAIEISGSPYHTSLVQYTTGGATKGIGQQDAKLAASAIVIPEEGNIIIVKQTDPDGDPTDFTFNPSWGDDFVLSDGEQHDSGPLVAGTYDVSETVPAGWDLTSATCDDGSPVTAIDLAAEETVTCTFNNQKDSTIIIEKQTLPDGSTQSFEFDPSYSQSNFFLTDGQSNNSGDLAPGTYSVDELTPTGWDETSAICSDQSPVTAISLQSGETVTCVFTNTERGHIVVDKVTDPSGDPQSFTFTTTGTGYSGFSLTDSAAPNDQVVLPGSYSVAETVPAGWDLTSATCDQGETPASLDVLPGETVTCTFNNQKDANIIVVKQTDPDASTVDFEFDTDYGNNFILSDGESNDSGDLNPGTYSVDELTPSGWVQSSATCDDGSPVTAIDLDAGETITCTFSNTQNGHIIIVKDVIGNPDPTDFTFHNNFGNGNPATFLLDEDNNATLPSSRDFEVLPGTYAVSEEAVTGWQSPESTNCTNGETIDSIDVAPGETVTCTFVNEEFAEIVLVKNTIGADGEFDFDGTGAGLPSDIDLTTVSDTATQTFSGLDQDNTYSIAENVPAGWDLTSATCDKGETPDDIDLEPGETVTCTFVNTKRGHIIVDKITIPAEDPQSFSFNATGGASPEYVDFSLTDIATPNDQELKPGVYGVSEALPAGWEQTDLQCVSSLGHTEVAVALSLNAGETITCTYTNGLLPTLRLEKTVVNDNGGTATESDFTPKLDNVDKAWDTTYTLSPGSYTASETNLAGYLASDWGTDCDAGGSVSLAYGDAKTCTITNDDIAPTLRLVKEVSNDDNGNATSADWDLTATGTSGFTDSGDSVAFHTMLAGEAYVLSESTVTGYLQEGTWICDGGTLIGSTVSLGLDEDVTCTVTNNDIAPRLTLTKVVNNNNGGTALPDDFALTVGGAGVLSGVTNSYDANIALALDETLVTGYSFVSLTGDPKCPSILGGMVALDEGENVACTITNDDDAPSLTLRKIVINDNGGLAEASDWNLSASGPTPISGAGGATSDPEFDAGTYDLSESGPVGYAAGDWICEGGTQDDADTVTIGLGQDVVCTITNNDIPGRLRIDKVALGGDATFDFTVVGPTPSTPSATTVSGVGTTGEMTIDAGDYSVAETVPTGWDLTDSSCTVGTPGDFTVPLDTLVVCTFENTKRGHLIVQKTTNPTGDPAVFDITASGTGGAVIGSAEGTVTDATDHDYEVTPGSFSVVEDPLTGWDETGNTCIDVVVAPGATETCEITNTKRGTITIVKDASPNDAQDFHFTGGLGAFYLDDDAGVQDGGDNVLSNSTTFANTVPGSYTVEEHEPNAFWLVQSISCVFIGTTDPADFTVLDTSVTVNLGAGEDITCTFTNRKLGPTRTQGFWKTHTAYTTTVLGAGITLGTGQVQPVDSAAKLFGGYFANIAKLSNGKTKRTQLDQARLQLAHQLMTAKLNCSAFGCPTAITTLIGQADAAYSGTNRTLILSLAGLLDDYNNSGDTIVLSTNPGPATPSLSKSTANIPYWDLMFH